jgi:integrase
MVIKKVATGWQANIQPGGRGGKRFKKTFALKADAIAWERHTRAKVQETPEWAPAKKDTRKLSDLVKLWHQLHGSALNAGDDTKRRLLAMCEAMNDPRADQFSADVFAEYRSKRLRDGVTANNMNREHAYLHAVFNELKRLKHWKRDNPLKDVRKLRVQESELSFLSLDQIPALIEELGKGRNKHAPIIAKVCLSTGARWGEAEKLTISRIRNGVIQYVDTKSTKARAVPITSTLETELIAHHEKHGDGERLFTSSWAAFREAVERQKLTLPDGQMTHVLRHTFASHFIINGGNILTLQKILGHHSLAMTMRYAHLAPDHLAEARRLNPLSLTATTEAPT